MKKLFYFIISIPFLTLFTSCEQEVKTYDGLEGVYFNVQRGAEWGDTTVWGTHSFTPVEFINVAGDTTVAKIRVMVTGRAKNHDRYFRVCVEQDSTTAVEGREYEAFNELQVLKAGTFYTDVMIRLYRTAEIAHERLTIGLKLEETNDLNIGIPVWYPVEGMWPSDGERVFDASRHSVQLSDFITRPSRWIGGSDDSQGAEELGLWGLFTQKKYRLICDCFDLVYEDFTTAEAMPNAKRTVIQEFMVKYLQERFDEGNPVLEEDGRLMWFMGVTWKSYVGVPYVPLGL